jgi:hypothetical protein
MNRQDLSTEIRALVAKAPEWLRHDFASTDPLARERAEDTLAAMIDGLIEKLDRQSRCWPKRRMFIRR